MCCYYVSGQEDRKDLYQEVFKNLWKGLESFRGDATLSTWAYRVTVNSALSFLAKVKARKETSAEVAEFDLSHQPSYEDHAPDDALELLRNAISKLRIVDMIIMSLVLEEANTREIAETTGLTESNVRVRIHRSKEKLRKLIEGDGS
jgi:RNA polymerase sigma-70 factor (ECF subfamily)